eukprot:767077-Hanusia_phi.AAC.3
MRNLCTAMPTCPDIESDRTMSQHPGRTCIEEGGEAGQDRGAEQTRQESTGQGRESEGAIG